MSFLLPNTTSKPQPLDLGIIQNFKVHYRHFFLRYVLSKTDECGATSDSVNILVAIRGVSQAWSMVREETFCKCFRKAGVLDTSVDVVTCGNKSDDEDPFLTSDASLELQSLIDQTVTTQEKCTLDEHLNGDDVLTICVDLHSDSQEESFLCSLAWTRTGGTRSTQWR